MLQIMFTSPREIIQKNLNNSKNKSVLYIPKINFLLYIVYYIYNIYKIQLPTHRESCLSLVNVYYSSNLRSHNRIVPIE